MRTIHPDAAGWSLAALAVAFQVLMTPTIGGNPIRIGAADALLPILLAFALWQWASGRMAPPRLSLPRFWWWLAALTLWLTISLVIGRSATGGWQKWALINKYGGWFILCGFLIVGMWAAQRLEQDQRDRFIRFFCATAAIISIIDILLFMVMQVIDPFVFPRLTGWAGNPNSFGYLLAVITVIALPAIHRNRLFGLRGDQWFIGLLTTALLFSGSRSAWVGTVCGLAVLMLLHEVPWRIVVRGAILGVLLSCVVSGLPWLTNWVLKSLLQLSPSPSLSPYFLRHDIAQDSGVNHRVRIMIDAFAMWRAHPVLGVGLGTFYWADTIRHSNAPATIHNSALWLLCETGLVGLASFTAFFIGVGRSLWSKLRVCRPDPLAVGSAAALAVLLGASVGMEAIYQRHVWFLAGYALAACGASRARDE